MTPEAIVADLLASGIEPRVTADHSSILVPAGVLSTEQRHALVAHKRDLIDYLQASSRLTVLLLEAAMRRCEQFNDTEEACQNMREQILETPLHLRRELLEYFLAVQVIGLIVPTKRNQGPT